MNILILTNNDSGIYQFRKELLERLVKDNNVICCTPDEDGYIPKIENIGCKVQVMDFNRRGVSPVQDVILMLRYIHIIKNVKADVVLTYTIKPNVYGGIACQYLKVPYISNVTGLGTTIENGGWLARVSLFLYRIGLKGAKKIFFQNARDCKVFQTKKVVSSINYSILPGSGVNTETHHIEEYPEDGDEFHFLFIGRVMKDKGIEELLNAIKKLKDNHYNVFLDIVGYYDDDDYSNVISEYEKEGLVKYHGIQEDVHSYYSASHCVVLPSYHEGMANVLLEAASVGRPVIATRIPGCKEAFDEGITGLGCDVKNTDSLYKAMKKMISLPWDKRNNMGKAGHMKMEKEFDRRVVVSEYLKEIEYLKR